MTTFYGLYFIFNVTHGIYSCTSRLEYKSNWNFKVTFWSKIWNPCIGRCYMLKKFIIQILIKTMTKSYRLFNIWILNFFNIWILNKLFNNSVIEFNNLILKDLRNVNMTEWRWLNEYDRILWTWPKSWQQRMWMRWTWLKKQINITTTTNVFVWI